MEIPSWISSLCMTLFSEQLSMELTISLHTRECGSPPRSAKLLCGALHSRTLATPPRVRVHPAHNQLRLSWAGHECRKRRTSRLAGHELHRSCRTASTTTDRLYLVRASRRPLLHRLRSMRELSFLIRHRFDLMGQTRLVSMTAPRSPKRQSIAALTLTRGRTPHWPLWWPWRLASGHTC